MTTRSLTISAGGIVSLAALAVFTYSFWPTQQPEIVLKADSRAVRQVEAPAPLLTFTERQAARLKARLARTSMVTPSVKSLAAALEEKKLLMQRTVVASFTAANVESNTPDPWSISMTNYPAWVRFVPSVTAPRFEIDADAIEQFLKTAYVPQLSRPRSASILSQETDTYGVTRVKADAIATSGYLYDIPKVASLLASALRKGESEVQWAVSTQDPTVTYVDPSGTELQLQLLSTGLSDYSNSPEGRISNVHKVFYERLQGVIIQPGETFSFNATLGGPVTLDKGWKEALGLFGGGAALTPGAGICQAATTVYRSALLAGLPIVRKRNHSLFVDHYEKYGIGLDATIFPGVHDLLFRNDTPAPIVMQTYLRDSDEVAVLQFYGIPDGRSVAMKGPFFASTAKKNLVHLGRAGLTNHEIAWIRTVNNPDGTSKEELITARYAKPLWRSLIAKYIDSNISHEELHAAAPAPIE